jgi:hypothetical protein
MLLLLYDQLKRGHFSKKPQMRAITRKTGTTEKNAMVFVFLFFFCFQFFVVLPLACVAHDARSMLQTLQSCSESDRIAQSSVKLQWTFDRHSSARSATK